MSDAVLKQRIQRKVGALKSSQLNEVYGLIENYFTENELKKEWDLLPQEMKQKIEQGFSEMNANKGIEHHVVMDNFRARYGSKKI